MAASRKDRLVSSLVSADFDALLLSSPEAMGYAHGFFEDGHERLLVLALHADGRVSLIGPALSESQAKRCGIADIRAWSDGQSPWALVEALADEWNLTSGVIGVDPTMRADHLLGLQHALPGAMFRSAESVLAQCMASKDEAELEWLRRASKLVEEVYEELLPTIRVGETELELAGRIQSAVLAKGGALNFCIVATGEGSAEPHHLNSPTPIREGDVLLMDFGCRLGHYHADITRVVSIGPASDEVKKVYRTVWEAHQAGRRQVAIGVTGAMVDRATREVIEQAGYGAAFTHRTGHGIGMHGHESPNMSADDHTPLAPGHCFTIEPGIYLSGKFGVRLENVYTVGDQGAVPINEQELEDSILELPALPKG